MYNTYPEFLSACINTVSCFPWTSVCVAKTDLRHLGQRFKDKTTQSMLEQLHQIVAHPKPTSKMELRSSRT